LLLDRDVLDNVALGLGLRGMLREARMARARRALQQLGVGHLAGRHARGLSGGEAQRVSLARALALDPEILFLDEPFSALDAPTRELLIADVSRLLRGSRLTSVVVTHDRDEALSLADRIAVLIGGTLRQVDSPDVVFRDPSDAEVASFVGIETVLPARVVRADEEITVLRVGEHLVHVTAAAPAGDDFPLLCIRPDDVAVSIGAPGTSSTRNQFAARVTALEPIGRYVRIVLDCGFPLIAHLARQSVRDLELRPGSDVVASFKATAPHLLPRRRAA
jgi:tungstate transport system ATP-binding protein